MSDSKSSSESYESCRPGDGYLAKEPVKSNGLTTLLAATSDKAGAVKNPTSGMTAPKASNPQVSK